MHFQWRFSLLLGMAFVLCASNANAQGGGIFGTDHHHHDAAGHRIDDWGHHIDNHGNHTGPFGVYDDYDDDYHYTPQYNYYRPQQSYVRPAPNVAPFKGVGLTIVNPAANNGTISYVVAGKPYVLQPGYMQTFNSAATYRISFNKGEGQGDAEYTIADANRYHFIAANGGWDLRSGDYKPAIANNAAPKVLEDTQGVKLAETASALQPLPRDEVAPESFQTGDRIAITSRVADVKTGAKTIGKVERDESFVVRQVRGAWLEIDFSANVRGWVHARDVRLESSGHADEIAPTSTAPGE
jgi:hypothetical protein